MSLPFIQSSDERIDYAALRALVVDDYPGIRSALRLTLSNIGVTKVQLVSNAAEAIFQIKIKHYDFILCDFNLGEGRDGQQLLEELRHSNLISLETVFIMVTAESYYEKVAATAELAPDDYMIKPFSAELLHGRLEGTLLRKLAFKKVYRYFLAQDLEASLAACVNSLKANPVRGGCAAIQGRALGDPGALRRSRGALSAGDQHARHPLGTIGDGPFIAHAKKG